MNIFSNRKIKGGNRENLYRAVGKGNGMDITKLNYFIALAEQRNMRKAAELLFVSQPTLSYYLNKLEEEVGTHLFTREKTTLQLTPAGKLYYEKALEVINIRNELYKEIACLDRQQNLVVGITSLWGNQVMAEIVPQLYQMFPEMSLEISRVEYHYLKSEVLQGKMDFYLGTFGFAGYITENMELLCKEELLFAVPKKDPFAQEHKEGISLKAQEVFSCVKDHALIISRPTSANYEVVKRYFMEQEEEFPEKICEVNEMSLTGAILGAGCGVGFIPESAVSNQETVSYYSVFPKLYRYDVLWCRKNIEQYPVQKMFYKLVMEYFQKK